MGRVYGANVVVGIPSFGMVSTYFLQARAAMQFPLVSSAVDKIVLDKTIAEARNEIVEFALGQNANYIFWLDDDVVAPPDAFLKLFRHKKDIINGVYWSKSNPPMPLLFRNHLEGPYYNWKVGDMIEIDAAGNGLTLVRTDVYRRMQKELGGPWYSTEYFSFAGVEGSFSPPNNTEDLYFYWKARKLGYKIWADTSVQALHYDKMNKVLYGIPPNSPQANPAWEFKAKGNKLIADLGSGAISPVFEDGEVISFDIREEVKPDVICDVRHLPVPDETFDVVFSSHTLEHFPWTGIDEVLKEWTRILKVGGELRLQVPNLRWSAKRILDDTLVIYDYWVLYGEQDYPKNFHAMGFTPNILRSVVESTGFYDNIEIQEGDINGVPHSDNWTMKLKATKIKHKKVENIAPDDLDPSPPLDMVWRMRTYDEVNGPREIETEIEAEKKIQKEAPKESGRKRKEKLLKELKGEV